jgi:phage shock protein A
VAEARARASEHAEHAAVLEPLWKQQAADVERLKQTLRSLNERIERAKRDKKRILARRKLVRSNETLRFEMRRLDEVLRLLERLSTVAEPVEDAEADGSAKEPGPPHGS